MTLYQSVYLVAVEEDRVTVRLAVDNSLVVMMDLNKGNAAAILVKHANIKGKGIYRGDDYLTGVIDGLTYCALTGAVPGTYIKEKGGKNV